MYVKVDDLNYNDKYVVDTQNKVAEHSTVKRVTKGSVVFPKRGAAIMTNKVRIMGIDGYMDTNMMALTSEKLDSEFLYNIISKEGLYKIADTSTIPQINNKHVEPYEVTIPSLDEQRKIGAYFKQLDHLITLHQRKGDETKKLKKFMLQKMFPKKDAKKPEIRFAGFTDDWEQRKLDEVVDFLDTQRKPLEGSKRVSGPYPYYGASGIVDYVEEYLFDEELILLSEDGANITDRNYPVCFLASGKYWVNNHAHVLKAKRGYENNFICNSMERKDFTPFNTGMAMPKLNQEVCRNIPILCPEYAEQKKIGDYFRNLDRLITLHQRKLFLNFAKRNDWEQRKLGEIITEYKETVDSDCTLPILTSSKTEGVILQEEHFGRKQQHDITGYNILPRNYCTYRNRSDGVDFTFNINICCDKGIISKFYPVFSGKNSDVFFLSLVLNNSEEVVHEIAYTCTGTGQKVLSFLDLQKMKVRVPNFDEQKEIAAYFESLDHLITLHRRAYYNKKGGLTNVHNDNQQHYAIL